MGVSIRRCSHGYTITEVLVSSFLLGFLAISLGHALTSSTRTSSRSYHRSVSHLIARNQAEIIRATGPYAAAADTFDVSATGEPTEDGPFTVEIIHDAMCEGGADSGDPAPTLPSACPTEVALQRYVITVRYSSRVENGFVRYHLTLGPSGSYSSTEASP